MNFIRMKLDTHYFLQDYEICETRTGSKKIGTSNFAQMHHN